MKFDMHCHTKEGSFDSKVPLKEYIAKYKVLGYNGFMITDHNSYKGCLMWLLISHRYKTPDFTVLCGIEYDTKDAGHVLVVMPDGLFQPLLAIRGMRVKKLAHFVHRHNGILGLAHPFGIPSSSAMSFKLMDTDYIKYMDFIEVFNTCEKKESNELAAMLAKKYNLPGFAGTDAHNAQYIGMAATDIDYEIHCNNDLIQAVKSGATITVSGEEREETRKSKAKDWNISQLGYRIYNRGLGKLKWPRRIHLHKKASNGHKPFQFKDTK